MLSWMIISVCFGRADVIMDGNIGAVQFRPLDGLRSSDSQCFFGSY